MYLFEIVKKLKWRNHYNSYASSHSSLLLVVCTFPVQFYLFPVLGCMRISDWVLFVCCCWTDFLCLYLTVSLFNRNVLKFGLCHRKCVQIQWSLYSYVRCDFFGIFPYARHVCLQRWQIFLRLLNVFVIRFFVFVECFGVKRVSYSYLSVLSSVAMCFFWIISFITTCSLFDVWIVAFRQRIMSLS